MALGWLCTPESMPSIWPWCGLGVALGGLSVQGSGFNVQGSMLDVRCWMFDVRARLGPAGGASTPEGQNRAQSTAHGVGNVVAAVQQVAHRQCRDEKQRCEDVKLRSFLGQAAWAPQASHCPLPFPDFRLETLDLRLFRPPLHNLKWHQPRHLLQGQK